MPENYRIIHPQKDEDGKENKQLLIATLGKRVSATHFKTPQEFVGTLMAVDGVDNIQPLGVYSIQIVIANTFDYDEVISNIKAVLEQATSSIVIPLKTHAPKLVT